MAGHRQLSHGGGINGFSTMIARYPDDRLAVIVLSNTAGAPAGGIASRIAKVMLGIEEKPVVDLPADEELLKPLVGTYDLDDEKLQITMEEGKLYVQPPGQSRDRLKYQGDQQFVSSSNEEVRFTFKLADGKASGVEVESPGGSSSAQRVEP